MSLRKWVMRKADRDSALQLAEEEHINGNAAALLVARGYSDPMEVEQFLSDELMLNDPLDLADMSLAAERVRKAIDSGEKILIYGDYDCDGVCATVLLYEFLRDREADVSYRLPLRDTEGYGLCISAVDAAAADGVALIITVDNGVSAHSEIERAKELGIDVVVTDHHLPNLTLPLAHAVVDPQRSDDSSEFKLISGVTVAFKLAAAVADVPPEELFPAYAELVALGTVADVVPLTDENRSMVKAGLSSLSSSGREGVKALIEVAGLKDKSLTAEDVAFTLAPRINAAGRMEDADIAARLLLSDDPDTARALADRLNDCNARRVEVERAILDDAQRIISEQNLYDDDVLVLAGEGWHKGVVGIAAARVVEAFGKPCFLLSVDGEIATGSGRSIPGYHIFNALQSAASLLSRYGGHALAAGATLPADNIPAFRAALNRYAAAAAPVFPELTLDCGLFPAMITPKLIHKFDVLAPYGAENPEPLMKIGGVKVEKADAVGKDGKHMRLAVSRDGATVYAVMFSASPKDFGFSVGDTVDLAVTAGTHFFNGRERVDLKITDIRLSGRDDNAFFSSLANYRLYRRGDEKADRAALRPTREECAVVFRFIRSYGEVSRSGLLGRFWRAPGAGKTAVIADVLLERGLLTRRTGGAEIYYSVAENTGKVNLEDSPVLQALAEKAGESDD